MGSFHSRSNPFVIMLQESALPAPSECHLAERQYSISGTRISAHPERDLQRIPFRLAFVAFYPPPRDPGLRIPVYPSRQARRFPIRTRFLNDPFCAGLRGFQAFLWPDRTECPLLSVSSWQMLIRNAAVCPEKTGRLHPPPSDTWEMFPQDS